MDMKDLVIAGCLAVGLALPALADPVEGVWQTAEGDAGGYLHVTFAPCGSEFCGTITTAFDENGVVWPEYEHLGRKIVWDMSAAGGGAYGGGRIWAPDRDKTYRSKMQLSGTALEVKGCVAGGAICRGQTWTQVK